MADDANDEWMRKHSQHLRPEDRELIRSYDPATAGLYLLLLNAARGMAEALFRPPPRGGAR